MKKLKDSGVEWIGQIPAEWKRVKLKEVTNIIMGQSPEAQDIKDFGNIPFMQGNREFGSIYPNAVKFCDNSPKKSRIGDILLSVRAPVGAINVSDKVYAIGRGLCSICATSINSKFLMYFLMLIMQDTKKFGQGSTFDAITIQELKQLPVLLPPINTQNRIASYLDRKCAEIDAIIAKQQQVIEKLKEYKLSVITEAVTKGLDPNVPMKDSGVEWIGKIPEHWTMLKLKHTSSILRGKFNHRPRNDPAYYDGNHPFVQTGDVARANKYIKSYSQTLNEKGYAVSKEFPANSICMTIAANVGDVAILTFDACFPDSVVGFVPSDNIAWDYLYYVLTAMKKQFVRNAIISTQLNLNIEIIKEEFIPVAPLRIQKEISKFLDGKYLAIDRTISAKQSAIDKLTDYKKSLIYEVVTGKKEIS